MKKTKTNNAEIIMLVYYFKTYYVEEITKNFKKKKQFE